VFAHTRIALAILRKPTAVLAFGTLLHDVGKPSTYSLDEHKCFDGHAQRGGKISEEICRRLRMSNEEVDQIVDLVLTHMDFQQVGEMRESILRRLLSKPNIADHLELYRVNCLSNQRSLKIYSSCLQKLEECRQEPVAVPLIWGEDLIAMGYSPGPIFKEILRTIEDLQTEGILRTREDAIQQIKASFPLTVKAKP
jgi:poly(A) polymerase